MSVKDKSPDNLWATVADQRASVVTPAPYGKIVTLKSGWIDKGSRVEGTVTYVKIWKKEKNKKGKEVFVPAGFKRMLKVVSGGMELKGKYIDADMVEPYYEFVLANKNKFSADVVALAKTKVGGENLAFTGEDLLNAHGLDESVSNAISVSQMDVLDKANDISFGADGLDADAERVVKKVADPNQNEITPEEAKKLHKVTKSKKSFGDWYKKGGKDTVDQAIQLLGILTGKGSKSNPDPTGGYTPPAGNERGAGDNDDEKNETKILGMSPLTFGIVAVLVLGTAGFFGYKYFKNRAK